ncbi:amidohydrolase [Ferrimonas balearica]|uniref:amidohydrolase n=1 Tax=Ferrimonas balearica TaxID=44012 RepID=UPI001C9947A5|nr:amidohydrolase family protein [Ferrimonas balearica]MBY5922006.1 amidohydrolase family protein [Ferrimonas balearica]MBY5994654.1 amidohydrolase family protein [Ferrimonas balearica]
MRHHNWPLGLAVTTALLIQGCGGDTAYQHTPADTVYTNGYIYTVDEGQQVAAAVAILNGSFVYVGDADGVEAHIGTTTEVINLNGKMAMPGLHDIHIHPLGIVALDACDLDSQGLSLDELVTFLNQCFDKYQYPSGSDVVVYQWNPFVGSEPNARYPTIRAALDAVSTDHAIFLMGSDGHHGAANSVALARATSPDGEVVGLSAATIAEHFSDYAINIGVDQLGEPDGNLTEGARDLIDFPSLLDYDLELYKPILPEVAAKLNYYGITSIQDAAAGPGSIEILSYMAEQDMLTFRATAALHYQSFAKEYPEQDALFAALDKARAEFDPYDYIKADTVKFFADGVIEGNPFTYPPTLPNAAMLERYEQPIIQFDEEALTVELLGYVDLDGAVCTEVRAQPEQFDEAAEVAAFIDEQGHHPQQCQISFGLLETPEAVLMDSVPKLAGADYTIHIHAIGDRAARVAINALEAAKNVAGAESLPHQLAHLQVVHPDDQVRIGELGIYTAFTYGWIWPEYLYDLTINPFIDQLDSLEPEDLYNPANYLMQNVYPTRTVWANGANLAAGSDAPVDTREPLPFYHMIQGYLRANEEGFVMNESERVDFADMVAAYTINGARALRQNDITGSIEVGKRADMIILDRNIIEVANGETPWEVAETEVLRTLFDGNVVYDALSQ